MTQLDNETLGKVYSFARTQVQLEGAFLEEVKTKKNNDESNVDYAVKLEFGKRIELLDEDTVDGFLRVVTKLVQVESDIEDLEITVIYRGRFSGKQESNEIELEKWVDMQIVPLLLSYVRTFVSNISIQMGFDPIVIPTMDVLETLKENLEIAQLEEGELDVNRQN